MTQKKAHDLIIIAGIILCTFIFLLAIARSTKAGPFDQDKANHSTFARPR